MKEVIKNRKHMLMTSLHRLLKPLKLIYNIRSETAVASDKNKEIMIRRIVRGLFWEGRCARYAYFDNSLSWTLSIYMCVIFQYIKYLKIFITLKITLCFSPLSISLCAVKYSNKIVCVFSKEIIEVGCNWLGNAVGGLNEMVCKCYNLDPTPGHTQFWDMG